MSRILSATMIGAAFAKRYPSPGGTVDLSAAEGTVPEVQAAAVRSFQQNAGKLVWVQADENFHEAGEIVAKGDYVQVTEAVAKMLVNIGRAHTATDDEVAAAQKADDGGSKPAPAKK